MTGRTFVDTNVLVYAVDNADERKRDIARAVIAEPSADLVISAQVLSEFYVVVTRRLAIPMSTEDAGAAVDELAKLPVVVVDSDLVRDGIALTQTAQISFWDALIVVAAGAAGCERVLTEDLAAGTTIGGVIVENPFASAAG